MISASFYLRASPGETVDELTANKRNKSASILDQGSHFETLTKFQGPNFAKISYNLSAMACAQ